MTATLVARYRDVRPSRPFRPRRAKPAARGGESMNTEAGEPGSVRTGRADCGGAEIRLSTGVVLCAAQT
jgi:hypothetical protein